MLLILIGEFLLPLVDVTAFQHLAFADDLILFSKASTKDIQGIKRVISMFCDDSSEMVNFTKSKLLLSNSFSIAFNLSICNELGVSPMPKYLLYLGVPLPFGRKKN